MLKKSVLFIVLSFCLFMVKSLWAEPLSMIEQLGMVMYKDVDFSYNSTQSCQTCHHHISGFADPDNNLDPSVSVVSVGADGVSLGGRNAPSAAYAGFSPILHWDETLAGYRGGMFWDGRATGHILQDPLTEQAQGPPLNPVEMNIDNMETLVARVQNAPYAPLFLSVFGTNAFTDTLTAFNNIARAIAAFERSSRVQKFNSRYDSGSLSAIEQQGLELFNQNCSKCHLAEPIDETTPALFTNYSYVNIGLPVNPQLAENPVDLGLGGFLQSDFNSGAPLIGDANFAAQYGKFKVPTLRNIPRTAPYGHNGYFATLKEMVNFHNSRESGQWPEAEVMDNVNSTDIGNMGLTEVQVDAIVAFLQTLTDSPRNRP